MSFNDSSFWQCYVYVDILGGSLERGNQTTVGLSKTAISVILLAIPSVTLEMRTILLHSDTQSIVGFSVIQNA